MSNDLVMSPREIKAALAVLEREQAADLPTRRQNALYRAFNIAAFATAIVVLFAVLEFLKAAMEIEPSDTELQVLAILFVILGPITIIFFFLNWGLIRKLYRQARLRRRLKVAYYFRPAFRAQRQATWLKNVVTMGIILLGLALIAFGLFAVLICFVLWGDTGWFGLSDLQFAIGLSASLALTFVGFGLASLHFVRRGKERLEVVTRLRETLSKETAGGAEAATLSSEDYDIVAGMEREHIIKHRASSIVAGRREAASSSYLCLASRQMYDAKSKLPQHLLSKVDETVLGLLTNPMPSNSVADPQTGNRVVPVPSTELSIQYDVNVERHLVRLHDLLGLAAA